MDLSGEPQPEQIGVNTGPGVGPQKTVLEVAAINIAKRNYQRQCSDYWNSTIDLTGTGRPVDCVISAVSAHSAVLPAKSFSMEYTLIPSVLDQSAVIIPVTAVDKAVDHSDTSLTYLHDMDRAAQPECKSMPILPFRIRLTPTLIDNPKLHHGSPVGIQLLGRRYSEEKLITLAEYIMEIL